MAKPLTIIVAAALFALVLLTPVSVKAEDVLSITDWLIPEFEGFRATPYWDVSRYSWGYGTRAPGPTGTITKEQAIVDMRAHVQDDYDTLAPQITRELTPYQWAALLSFAYQEGTGNPGAGALVDDINAGDDRVLEQHFKRYVYAGGVVNSNIVARRNREWEIWSA